MATDSISGDDAMIIHKVKQFIITHKITNDLRLFFLFVQSPEKKHVVKINKQCYILTCPGFDVVSLKNPSFTEKLSKEWCHIVPKKRTNT